MGGKGRKRSDSDSTVVVMVTYTVQGRCLESGVRVYVVLFICYWVGDDSDGRRERDWLPLSEMG